MKFFLVFLSLEYDRYLASSKTMAAAYLDPNLNHTPSSGAKTHLSTGMERSPGAMERVLKVFHYFENSSEPTTWASNIRHGDATDVRVSPFFLHFYAIFRLSVILKVGGKNLEANKHNSFMVYFKRILTCCIF